ncbi:uncharacterized protein MONOS_13805 [Monocercomonoides exilis]|uniref:uncharacterized protein n=1 Tax=Monocercomonoides exilis TaxID=2049356 RepID=UPI003559AE5C|nr:hypothetical protein MONOS_13805 [Monocercomonoides exilis]|eukprot:MONOS_13805.1-p1 / transcript=MONOS_13805.1 / gene=MONOS_13805 / organism=Monocercomonoides_exilis_PA203 / gene_product=unspecified product / transcript_product=unspecified product / location=Mono_scaffold00886:6153-6707(+) / protein_length=185 / sequence_SO=supercontig / SO=protein_coding / is_pseudo=false
MHTKAQMESAMSMHFGFVEEGRRELEELEKRGNWQRKERRVKELKDIHTILRWLKTLNKHFVNHQPSRERNTRLAAVVVGICRKARVCFVELSLECLVLLEQMNESASLSVCDFVTIEAVDVFLEEITRSVVHTEFLSCCLDFVLLVLDRLREKDKESMKQQVLVKLEREGLEDLVNSFLKTAH